MVFGKTILTVSVVIWSVLLIGHLEASPDENRLSRSNNVRDLLEPPPINLGHRSRRKRTAASAAEQDEILRIHNNLRQKEGAAGMYRLRWNAVLARMAETWSTGCNFVHGQSSADTSSLSYQSVGQNLFAGEYPVNLTSAIMDWFNEKFFFFFRTNSCTPGKVCGHYTQVVWSTTYEVGCGYTVCRTLRSTNLENVLYLVCNYGPGGNTIGTIPYQIGPACTNCSNGQFFCNSGLCDNTCTRTGPTCTCSAACQNCGTATTSCSCSCAVGWFGSDCSRQCKDFDARCGANPGWPASRCSSEATVATNCPAMCGKCVVGSGSPCISTKSTVGQQNLQTTVQSRPDNANPMSSTCLCVQGTNVAVRSTADPRASVLRWVNTNDCFRSLGVVSVFAGRRWYMVNAAQGDAMVSGWIDGQYLTDDAWCPTNSGSLCFNPNQRFTNGLASCCLEAGSVWRSPSAVDCSNTYSTGSMCTSLSNIRCRCLEELILFRRESQASTRFVRGTDPGGDWNRANGYMVSLERSQTIDYYVSWWFTPAGVRASDGSRQWKSPRGSTWIMSSYTWDVYCP